MAPCPPLKGMGEKPNLRGADGRGSGSLGEMGRQRRKPRE